MQLTHQTWLLSISTCVCGRVSYAYCNLMKTFTGVLSYYSKERKMSNERCNLLGIHYFYSFVCSKSVCISKIKPSFDICTPDINCYYYAILYSAIEQKVERYSKQQQSKNIRRHLKLCLYTYIFIARTHTMWNVDNSSHWLIYKKVIENLVNVVRLIYTKFYGVFIMKRAYNRPRWLLALM